ncbi:hypothetical protein VTK73DRAFT_4002 [Phialemonium thermophilum]|uniref:Uncharacterized protein n=1 Tax=Phialemonium thermophilum TaxID=223376 RepID=A0ABR3VD20_9PEZI
MAKSATRFPHRRRLPPLSLTNLRPPSPHVAAVAAAAEGREEREEAEAEEEEEEEEAQASPSDSCEPVCRARRPAQSASAHPLLPTAAPPSPPGGRHPSRSISGGTARGRQRRRAWARISARGGGGRGGAVATRWQRGGRIACRQRRGVRR